MKSGFGKVVITPPVGFSLVGYFNDRHSEGIRDDLYAICVIFDDGKNIFAIVSCDLIWVDKSLVRKVRRIVSKELNIPYSNITIHATHTHTGPVSSSPSFSIFTKNFYVEKSYIELLPVYIAGSIKIAYKNREDVGIGIDNEEVKGISFNRRYLLKDGRVITNPFLQIGDIVKNAGSADNSIGVMKIVNKKGVLKGVIVNFALHPDTLGDNLISADWPGFLRNRIEKNFPGTVAMVLNGPSGDINHINPFDYKTRNPDIGKKISKKIFSKIKKFLLQGKIYEFRKLKFLRKRINLPYRDIKEEEIEKAKEYLRDKKGERTLKEIIYLSLIEIYKEKKKGKKIKTEINAFSFNNKFSCIFLPGEIFTGIGVQIKNFSPFENTWIVQNSNDAIKYIPTEEAFTQHEKNLEIKKEYDDVKLTEAIGINCSYETTPLGSKVGKRAESVLLKEVKKILDILST